MTPSMVFSALPRPLCRYASIILLADDTRLLTELSNVVAYPCRRSRAEDRRMAARPARLLLLRLRPHLLERPNLRLVRAGRVGEHGQIVAGEQQLHALADIELQQLLAVGSAHARPLAMLLAGGDDLVDGLLDPGMAILAGNAHFHRQVARADQQAVDARHRRDRLGIAHRLGRL